LRSRGYLEAGQDAFIPSLIAWQTLRRLGWPTSPNRALGVVRRRNKIPTGQPRATSPRLNHSLNASTHQGSPANNQCRERKREAEPRSRIRLNKAEPGRKTQTNRQGYLCNSAALINNSHEKQEINDATRQRKHRTEQSRASCHEPSSPVGTPTWGTARMARWGLPDAHKRTSEQVSQAQTGPRVPPQSPVIT
jgi:hypothetical protein